MTYAATRLSRCLSAAMLAVLLAAPVAAKGASQDEEMEKLLTRSIYLPVQFELCDHLHDAVIYMGERPLAVLPAKRIFQFTYYPHLDRVEPVRSDVRVEGQRDDGSDFVGKLAVTPRGIFTASSEIALDLEAQLRRLRYKLDVRYETLSLRLRCDDACERAEPASAVVAAGPTEN